MCPGSVLSHILEQLKVSLHPILPVLTSEVFSHQLSGGGGSDCFVMAGEDRAALWRSWANPEVVQTVEELLRLKEKALQAMTEQGLAPDLKAGLCFGRQEFGHQRSSIAKLTHIALIQRLGCEKKISLNLRPL